MKGYISLIVFMLLYSCKKLGVPPSSLVEDKYIKRSVRLYLYDKIGDTTIMSTFDKYGKIRYNHDSVRILEQNGSSFFEIPHTIEREKWPIGFRLDYLATMVNPDSEIEDFRFNYCFLVKWNWKEIDTLGIIKDINDEIRFYTNGQHYKTVAARDKDVAVTFYR